MFQGAKVVPPSHYNYICGGVPKIAPYHTSKFGGARKKPYLCKQKTLNVES